MNRIASKASLKPPAQRAVRRGKFRYKTIPNPLFFPVEEKVPESPRHLENRTELWQCAVDALSSQGVISSDQFLFPDPRHPQKRLAPDLMIRLGPAGPPPKHWKTWQHGTPDIAVEIVSPSDSSETPWEAKMKRYRMTGIKELFRFDDGDIDAPLRAWDWLDDEYLERELDQPRAAESLSLGLYFVVVEHPLHGPWLRLARDPEGKDLLPTLPERTQQEADRAQKEADRAQKEADRAQKEADRADQAEQENRALREELARLRAQHQQ